MMAQRKTMWESLCSIPSSLILCEDSLELFFEHRYHSLSSEAMNRFRVEHSHPVATGPQPVSESGHSPQGFDLMLFISMVADPRGTQCTYGCLRHPATLRDSLRPG
jgi:hypothetical protein